MQQRQTIRFPRLRMPNAQAMEGMRDNVCVYERGNLPSSDYNKAPVTYDEDKVAEWTNWGHMKTFMPRIQDPLQGLGVGGLVVILPSFKAKVKIRFPGTRKSIFIPRISSQIHTLKAIAQSPGSCKNVLSYVNRVKIMMTSFLILCGTTEKEVMSAGACIYYHCSIIDQSLFMKSCELS